MSGDQGQVLVESSPGSQGIDSYAWSAGSLNSNPTFLTLRRSPADKKDTSRDKKKEVPKKHTEDERMKLCVCGLGPRVRQLRHDIVHLNDVHEKLLRGLHEQIEQLKIRNRGSCTSLPRGRYVIFVILNPRQKRTGR
ncbi:uncharacterized protein LOC125178315 [Hyalella azteca]|uniref:Uncharacterized protein LOC125178315 n=1 Tax=Hyalella azteca TaxID=294128 RepID=A0A979FL48_HYAAZ|nr:uncharacterized protein LOC125178315 [Hyalella azteca]